MTRQQFLRLSGLAGCGGILQGCEGLKELEKMPEGAGVQVVSGIIFLAKYKATARQLAEAHHKGAKIYVSQALKPVAERKLRTIRSTKAKVVSDAPPEKRAQVVKEIEQSEAEVVGGYYALASKAGGGRVPVGMNLDEKPVEALSANHEASRALMADVSRSDIVGRYIAIEVVSLGKPEELKNPSGLTVIPFDTKSMQVADNEAFIFGRSLRQGEKVKLDGITASYWDS